MLRLLPAEPPKPWGLFGKRRTLAPQNSEVLWHYGQALRRAGQKDAAEKVLAKVKRLGNTEGITPRASAGVLGLDSSGLAPANLAALRKLAAANPADWRLKLRLGEEFAGGVQGDSGSGGFPGDPGFRFGR